MKQIINVPIEIIRDEFHHLINACKYFGNFICVRFDNCKDCPYKGKK